MSAKILINGNFLCRNLTGIERFAFETCRQLDMILAEKNASGIEFSILVPNNAKTVPEFRNIHTILSEKPLKSFPKWDMFEIAREAKKRNAVPLNFSNTAPLGKKKRNMLHPRHLRA